jgi:hypothetical protein
MKIATGLMIASTVAAIHAVDVEFGNPPTGGNSFPFNQVGSGIGTRYQQVYNASQFSGPLLIDTISFFDSDTDASFRTADYAISLSTTSKSVNGLDTVTFANNIGPDNALFFSGHLTGAVGAVRTFDGVNFAYNPAAGNLLIDIQISNIGALGAGFMDARNGDFGTDSSRAHNFGTGTVSFGLRTLFSSGRIVGTPDGGATLLLLTSALSGLMIVRRRAQS